jgi:hypothetical protein
MKDKYKIQIGDVLFEYSKSYHKIFEWKVLNIWLEDYIGGNKTIVKCSNGTWTKEFFASDILVMCRSREVAEAKLKESENNA